jgi:hypothetical protein
MQSDSRLFFGGQQFSVKEAEIAAAISDPYWCDTYNRGNGKSISWAVTLKGASTTQDSQPPSVYLDGLRINVRNWHDLVGYEESWQDPIDDETGEEYGTIYVHDHQGIANGSVRIIERRGANFRVVAAGENEEGQRFEIDAMAAFRGVYVRGSEFDSDKTANARLRQFLDDSNLVASPFVLKHQYGSGVKMGDAFYKPRTE